jgi:cytidylate kinase
MNAPTFKKIARWEYPKKASVDVTDSEAKKIYDERKEQTPELIVSRGGVSAQGIMFDSQDAAKAFLEKAQAAGANFDSLAKEENLTIKPLQQVSAQSFDIDTPIREKLLAITNFPTVDMVVVKDKAWVVKANSKEDAQYVPFEQVKDPIKQQLKMQKLFTDELEKIKKTMDIVEHKQYFDKKKKDAEGQMEKARQEQTKTKEAAPLKVPQNKQPAPAKPVMPAPKKPTPVKGA